MPRAMARITPGCAASAARSKRAQRRSSGSPPCAASSANGASQALGSDLPLPAQIACRSRVHAASAWPKAIRACAFRQRRPGSSMVGSQAARKAGHSLRRASAASQSLRKAMPAGERPCRARKAAPRAGGKVSRRLRRAAYSSQPASGCPAWAAMPASSSRPRPARSKASRIAADGNATGTGGFAARGAPACACTRGTASAHSKATRQEAACLCMSGL